MVPKVPVEVNMASVHYGLKKVSQISVRCGEEYLA
jgi:hypothetical protein